MIKIAINGFGRIGRPTLRRILESHPDLEVVAINDLADTPTLAHLFKYDSVYGIYKKEVQSGAGSLTVDGKKIKVLSEPEPENLPWKELGVDIVLECTGLFRDLEGARKHISAGAKQVVISAPARIATRSVAGGPAKSEEIPAFVLGVNEEKFEPDKDNICDMASCTTNCLAPVVKVLNDSFKIINGFMTTIHSYTTTQRILDLPHKDLRRARAAALNIIPTTTGAAKSIAKVMPELEGRLGGIAMRVPTPTVSIVDLICRVEKAAPAQKINQAFEHASQTKALKGILSIEEAPLVSSDYIGNTFSAIVDATLTAAKDDLVKIVAWYDNEYAYACRLAEFAEYVGRSLGK